jgi:CHAT domain-containing protein/tetratricopeptide (TPR) repeat protein
VRFLRRICNLVLRFAIARPVLARLEGSHLFVLLFVLLAAAPSVTTPPDSLSFVDRYAFLRWKPYTAAERLLAADALTADDPDDVLGNWVRGTTIAGIQVPGFERTPADSAAIRNLQRSVERQPDRPGLHLALGGTGSPPGDPGAARRHMLRAVELYRSQGRSDDAFHALYLLTRVRPVGEAAGDDLALLAAEAEARGDPMSRAMALSMQARDVYRRDFGESQRLRERALEILRPLPPNVLLVDCLNGIGNCRRRSGDFDGAQPFHEEALGLARSLDLLEPELAAVEGLALIAKNRRDWTRALELFEQNMKLAETWGDVSSYVTTLHNARQIHRGQGNYVESRWMAERSLELVRTHELDSFLTSSLDAMATEEIAIGRLDEGRTLLEQSVRSAEATGRKSDIVFPLIHLANVYQDLGDLEQAMELAERALAIAREIGHRRGEMHLQSVMAGLFAQQERYEEAIAAALPLVEDVRGGDPGLSWSAARTAAVSLAALGRADEGIAVLDSCDARYGDASVHAILQLENRAIKGDLLCEDGRAADALPFLEHAREQFLAIDDMFHLPTANTPLARAYMELGRVDDAIAVLKENTTWAESVQSGLTVGDDREVFLSLWYNDYVALARARAMAGDVAGAVDALERSRATEMRRLYGSAAPGLPERVRPELALEVEQIEARLAVLQATVLEQRTKPPGARSADFAALVARTDSLRHKRDALVRTVLTEAPEYSRELGLLPPVRADDLLRALQPGDVFLATMTGNRTTLVFRATAAEGWKWREFHWGIDEASSRVDELLSAARADSPSWRTHARALADSLLGSEPWSEVRCIVSPDGPFLCLPFELLDVRVGATDERRLLVEECEVLVTPSATLYLADQAGPPAAEPEREFSLVAFGDPALPDPGSTVETSARTRAANELELRPLPHARREVERLGERFPGSRIFVGRDATERRLFDEVQHASVLHVASHAIVDDDRPAYSGLVLFAGEDSLVATNDDGLVQAFEILRREMPLDLVVLSACDTGRGKVVRGEGLLGLSRAFRLAGAKTLLVSLWEVDDAATAELMESFYDAWTKGATISAALRSAKLEFLGSNTAHPSEETNETRGVARRAKGERRASPALWAPFVVQGSLAAFGAQGTADSVSR